MFRDDRLAGGWSDLATRLQRTGALTRWASTEPCLAELPDLDALQRVTAPGADRERADEVLGALVRCAAVDGGRDPEAVLVVLHLLAGGVHAIARRLGGPSREVLSLVVNELTLHILTFPWRRRSRSCAANLLLDTRATLLRELGQAVPSHRGFHEVPVDPTELSVLGPIEHPACGLPGLTPAAEDGTESELGEVLDWAVRSHLVGADDVALLVEFERARGYGARARQRVSAAHGIHERTLRRRRDRTLAALRQAGASYRSAVA